MSTNSKKKCDTASRKGKYKSEINTTEVFVMPPNLLEKLGINLGNIYNPAQSPIKEELKHDHFDETCNRDFKSSAIHQIIDKEDNDSILETANLMKKSVLLSPTFIALDSNVISGEVEIAKIVSGDKGMVDTSQPQIDKNTILLIENNKKNEILPLSSNSSSNAEIDNVEMKYCEPNYIIENNTISASDNKSSEGKKSNCTVIDSNIYDTEEAYSSESINLFNVNMSNTVLKKKEPKKKVIIISEEIVDPAQLKTLFSPTKTVLTPMPMNTLISKTSDGVSSKFEVKDHIIKKSEHFINADLNNTNIFSKYDVSLLPSSKLENSSTIQESYMSASHSNDEVLDNIKEINVNCNNITPGIALQNRSFHCSVQTIQTIETSNNVNEDCKAWNSNDFKNIEVNDYKRVDKNQSVINDDKEINNEFHMKTEVQENKTEHYWDEASSKTYTNSDIKFTVLQNKDKKSNTNIPVDKVSEITAYLTSFFNLSNKKKSRNVKKNNFRESDTKLSIQGVEKPGGVKQKSKRNLHDKNIRTYQRKNRAEKLVSSTIDSLDMTKLETILTSSNDSEELLTVKSFRNVCNTRPFCVCSDFGQLSFYDWDELYEHIHFCNSKNVNCDLNLIFSIYNDNDHHYIAPLEEVNEDVGKDSDDNDLDFNICWNEIQEQEDLYMDQHILISQENVECDKQFVNKSNTIVDNMLHCKENKDNNDKVIQKDSFNEDGSVKEDCEVIVIVDTVEEYGGTETGDVLDFCQQLQKQSISQGNKDATTEDSGNIIQSEAMMEMNKIQNGIIGEISDQEQSKHLDDLHEKQLQADVIVLLTSPVCHTGNVNKKGKCRIENSTRKTLRSSMQEKIQDNKSCKTTEDPGNIIQSKAMVETNEFQNGIEEVSDQEQSKHLDDLHEKQLQSDVSCHTEDVNKKGKCHVENSTRKRLRSSMQEKIQDNKSRKEIVKKKTIKCGLCDMKLQEVEWESHISSEHCYVAWLDGDTIDLETYLKDKSFLKKINDKLRKEGTLKCTFCKLKLKKASSFLRHVKTCYDERHNEVDKNEKIKKEMIKCGICKQDIEDSKWVDHTAKAHDYLAWKEGDPPLDLSNDDSVWEHLNVISKDIGGLVCSKCGILRKYAKYFLAHMKVCEGNTDNSVVKLDTTINDDSSVVGNDTKCEQHLEVTPQRKRRMNNSKTSINSSVTESNPRLLNETMDISLINTSAEEEQRIVIKCGVCAEELDSKEWPNHIQKKHNYVAWKEGEPPLDLDDENIIRAHLLKIVHDLGGLTCPKCGTVKKKPKVYLNHLIICEKLMTKSKADDTAASDNISADDPCECAVCSETFLRKDWQKHAMDEHYNLAWINGEKVYDLLDKNTVLSLLTEYQKQNGKLICKACKVVKKAVLVFYKHIAQCGKSKEELTAFFGKCEKCNKKYLHINKDKHMELHMDSEFNDGKENSDDGQEETNNKANICQCGVCSKKILIKNWKHHIMSKHYNIAWMVGEEPLDLNSPNLADKLLKEYKGVYGKFICKLCGDSKASTLGFYAHILVCGKPDEETEQFKALCAVCNNKYMRIYEYQHMRAHRDAEIAREMKLQAEIRKQREPSPLREASPEYSRRNRKAALKAKNVIEEYKSNDNICEKCESSSTECKCVRKKRMASSDSDASAQFESSGTESNHSSVFDEHISDEEENKEIRKKKSHDSGVLKTRRIPFCVSDESSYINHSYKDFCKRHLTDNILFEEWYNFEYEVVSDCELDSYMPILKESCQVHIGTSEWLTIPRFDAKMKCGDMGIFTGGSVSCMRWAPSRLGDHYGLNGHWLAVVANLSNDQPRHNFDELPKHPALIQIWNVGDFDSMLPKFELGLALDNGTIWAMDWCPSGARDLLKETNAEDTCDKPLRLGLIAVACSDGKAYIIPVPYPSTIVKKDKIFIKMNPAVELRLTDGEDRKLYQATSVCWSTQKGHSLIVVGYSDGTVAFYDIKSNSPLLKTNEGNKSILYPYHDERFQNTSLTGLGVFPGHEESSDASMPSAWCAAAVSVAQLRVGDPMRCARATQASLVTNDVVFSPHWPALLLAGDDALVALVVNELEIWGLGRRTGSVRTITACQRCASVACFTPPFIRTMVTHPIYKEIRKKIVGEIALTPIGSKIKEKKPKDELTVKLEPKTYEEIITQYGITIKHQNDSKLRAQKNAAAAPSKVVRADRYPLADVTSLAFCTTGAFHNQLAIATQSGLVFFMKV